MQAQDHISVVILAQTIDEKCQLCLQSLPESWPVLLFLSSNSQPPSRSIHPRITLIPVPPITDFSAARNYCLRHATTPWVFFIDSDEILQPFSIHNLETELTHSPHAGLTVARSDVFKDKQLHHGEAGRQKIVRIVRTNSVKFTGIVHEIAVVNGSIGPTSLIIKHYSHDSIGTFLQKISTYAQLTAAKKKYQGWRTWMELFFYPVGKWLWNMGPRLGVLDGWRGLVYATLMSWHSTCVRLLVLEKHLTKHA